MLCVRIACRISVCEVSLEATQSLPKDSRYNDDHRDKCNRFETRPKHSSKRVSRAGRTQQPNQAIHIVHLA